MNKINKRFFYYKTKAAYLQDLDRIPEDSIVFIENQKCIVTHGVEYKYSDDSNTLDLNELSEEQKQGINSIIQQYIEQNGIQEIPSTIDITNYVSVINGTLLFQNI